MNVASIGLSLGYPHFDNPNLEGNMAFYPLKAYGRSKLAQMLFTYELAKRFKASGTQITVYALHPGVVNTDIVQHFPWILRGLIWGLKTLFMIRPELGAQTTLHCAFNEDAGRESGFYYE